MTFVWLLLLLVVLVLLRQNIILILAAAALYIHVFIAEGELQFLVQDMWFAVDREVLLSVPLFLLAGAVMTRGSIARRIVDLMVALTAPLPGGLAIGAVMSCATFAAISGSSIVTMLAVGTIMYPALIARGYPKLFSIGLIAASGTLGIIIPPSIPMILYGIVTETSIANLFLAGFGPGGMLALLFTGYALWINRRMETHPWSLGKIWLALRKGIFALMLPVVLLGGIYSGYYSPTEAAAAGLAYALVIEVLVHREMTMRDYVAVSFETVKLLGTLLLLLAIAHSVNTILDYKGVPEQMVEIVKHNVESPVMMMVAINILLLIVGCFMDIGAAIMILAPFLLPLAQAAGYDAIHFGIIMIVNLEIGYLTPPVGINLMVAMVAFRESFGTVIRAALPFVALMLAGLIAVVAVPELSLFLLN